MTDDLREFSSEGWLEDEEDRRIAVARLNDDLPPIPLAEVVKQLNLEDVDRRSTPHRA